MNLFSMPFWHLQILLPQHMPAEIFLFSHYSGYELETKVIAVLKRNSMYFNKICIAIGGKYSNASSTCPDDTAPHHPVCFP